MGWRGGIISRPFGARGWDNYIISRADKESNIVFAVPLGYHEGTMNKDEIRYMKLENKIEQVALIMHRLNNMWSFTGSQLSYACDNYMRPRQLGTEEEKINTLLQAYAALTKAVTFYTSQGYVLPEFWDSTFAKLGQDIVYTLPEMLHPRKEKAFYKNLTKGFAHAWGESPLPPARDTVCGK